MVEYLKIESMSVSDPYAFFEAVQSWNPTHIVLDLVMPVMDGVEVLQQLGQLGCQAKITISSGVGNRVLNAAKVSAIEHGLVIAGALSKPFSLGALEEFLCGNGDGQTTLRDRPQTHSIEAAITQEEVQNAVERKEFELVFQPKIDCLSRRLTGFEALIRWNHPTRGLVMPDRFIPLSEHLGLIQPITNTVVDLALDWLVGASVSPDLNVAINISAKTIGEHDFANWLESRCLQAGVSTDCIALEITETAVMDDPLLNLDMFTRLRMKGFNISIDDFGIGHSSLALLARLPFSEVKVDKRFAMTAASSLESKAIIKSTVDLSHSLGLTVVAEGVEDSVTLDYLTEIGCDQAQGYFIARPLRINQIKEWMVDPPYLRTDAIAR